MASIHLVMVMVVVVVVEEQKTRDKADNMDAGVVCWIRRNPIHLDSIHLSSTQPTCVVLLPLGRLPRALQLGDIDRPVVSADGARSIVTTAAAVNAIKVFDAAKHRLDIRPAPASGVCSHDISHHVNSCFCFFFLSFSLFLSLSLHVARAPYPPSPPRHRSPLPRREPTPCSLCSRSLMPAWRPGHASGRNDRQTDGQRLKTRRSSSMRSNAMQCNSVHFNHHHHHHHHHLPLHRLVGVPPSPLPRGQ